MIENYPKISIVTACYNHVDYIGKTIESIISQNYPNLEYVVIDDGSTDGSWEVIQKYKDKLFYCERLEGYRDTPTVALNYGFSKISGEIMGWLNSDDMLLPDSLFTLAKIFNDCVDVEWVTGIMTAINKRSEITDSKWRLISKYDYLCEDWKVIQQESTFWRRRLWDRVGGKLEGKYKWAFDTELWTRFFMVAEHYHVSVPLGAFRFGDQSKSISTPDNFMKPSLKYLKEMRQKAPVKIMVLAFIYYLSNFFSFMLGFVPDRIIKRIPLLKRFTYKMIYYSFLQDRWLTKVVSPYRRYHV